MSDSLNITSANAIYVLAVPGVFPVPVQLEGYGADAAFSTESISPAEVVMGVDGHLSVGFVHVPVRQTITLMPDSASVPLFETWDKQQRAIVTLYYASCIITLKSVNRTYIGTKGALTAIMPVADARRVLAARTFGITWERLLAEPFA